MIFFEEQMSVKSELKFREVEIGWWLFKHELLFFLLIWPYKSIYFLAALMLNHALDWYGNLNINTNN